MLRVWIRGLVFAVSFFSALSLSLSWFESKACERKGKGRGGSLFFGMLLLLLLLLGATRTRTGFLILV